MGRGIEVKCLPPVDNKYKKLISVAFLIDVGKKKWSFSGDNSVFIFHVTLWEQAKEWIKLKTTETEKQ